MTFHVLAQFLFTISEIEPDQWKINVSVASRFAARLNTGDARRLLHQEYH